MVTAVSVQGLRKSFGPVRALDDVSFEVETGQVFALLGPNGAGKTTSIEILEGFTSRDDGTVQVLGIDPGERHQQRWLRTRLGIVLQELAVEPFFTVRQVLDRNAGFYPSPRPVGEVLELVNQAGVALRLARVKPAVEEVLKRDGILDRLGADRTHGNVHRAVQSHLEQAGNTPPEE